MGNILGDQVSKNELERRWKAVREAMTKEGLDCLVMQNSQLFLGGYVRYFTDIPAPNYGLSVLFPLDDEMTVIAHPVSQRVSSGVKQYVSNFAIQTLNYTDTMAAKAVVKAINELKVKAVGFVSKASMSASFYEYIKENLPKEAMHDATDLVDDIKAVKSDEEIRLIKRAVEIHDKVIEAAYSSVDGARPLVRPGVLESQLNSEIRRLASDMGSESAVAVSCGAAPAGTPAYFHSQLLDNRELKHGDQVAFLIEFNGPGGFYGEMGRTVCIGAAPKPMTDLWNDAVEDQDRSAKFVKPGVDPREMFNIHSKLCESKGWDWDRRIYVHGQGYDAVERPGARPDETMKFKAGMHMAIHPSIGTKEAFAFCCDNFLVTNSGTIRLNKTPREVFVV